MHYRNGREAHNGDPIIDLSSLYGAPVKSGILRDATPGDDFCNGYMQTSFMPSANDPVACMCDCLHLEDLQAILAEKGLDERPTSAKDEIPTAEEDPEVGLPG